MKRLHKIKEIMRSISIAIAGGAMVTLMTGCYDELATDNGRRPDLAGDGGLTVCIPGVASYSTRADVAEGWANATDREADLNSLWLIGFPHPENAVSDIVGIDLVNRKTLDGSTIDINQQTSGEYKTYKISDQVLPQGRYRFYFLANIEDYLEEGALQAITNEASLRGMKLDFSGLNDVNTLVPGNLPMICLAEDARTGASLNTKLGSTSDGANYFSFTSDAGGQSSLYADLEFQCSKVRYTIFYDSNAGGVSEQWGSTIPAFNANDAAVSAPTASNLRKETEFIYTAAADGSGFNYPGSYISEPADTWSIPLTEMDYPGYGNSAGLSAENYLPSAGVSTGDYTNLYTPSANLGELSAQQSKKRAWQGVVYIPENKQTLGGDNGLSSSDISNLDYTSGNVKVSYLTFPAKVDNNIVNYRIPVEPWKVKSGSGSNATYFTEGIGKGTFCDAVIRLSSYNAPTVDCEFNVSDWTVQNLEYQLHGPYELVLETSQIGVKTGETTTFWYRSDISPEDIERGMYFPEITWAGQSDPVPFYVAEIYRDEDGEYILENGDYQIAVRVNPLIPYTVLQEYKGENNPKKEEVNYLHVVAGNIQKKIKVDPLDLEPYLSVSPKSVTINVEEYLASGINKKTIDLEFETNVDVNIKVKDAGGLFGGVGGGALQLYGYYTSASGNEYTLRDKVGTLQLDIDGILKGLSYWNEEHTYTLEFSVNSDEDVETEILTIHVKPYTTNYTIYFRDKTKEWSNPHIYVYQCLEIPSGSAYSGRTVGYREVKDGSTNYYAALEYAFTGNLSFRGWKGYGGPDANDPTYYADATHDIEGFIMLGNLTNNNDNTDDYGWSYNPYNKSDVHYDLEVDLNTAHEKNRSNWKCNDCKTSYSLKDTGRLWPGISMEEVTIDGVKWYKYSLSGVATPGKAMIIFTNIHSGNNPGNGQRFPQDAYVGVPLFDFRDHEGWLVFNGDTDDYSGNYFVDDMPEPEPEPEPEVSKYRLYWPQILGSKVYLWVGQNTELVGQYNSGDNEKTDIHSLSNYYYKDFEYGGNESVFNYIFTSNTGDHNGISFSEFTTEVDGRKCAFITRGDFDNNNGDIHSGVPAETFYQGDQIMVTWDATTDNKNLYCMYIEYSVNGNNVWDRAWPGYKNTEDVITGDWPHLQLHFTVSRDIASFTAKANNEGNGNEWVKYFNYSNIKNTFIDGKIQASFY